MSDIGYLFRVEKYSPILKAHSPFVKDSHEYHKLGQWYTNTERSPNDHVGYSTLGKYDPEYSIFNAAVLDDLEKNSKILPYSEEELAKADLIRTQNKNLPDNMSTAHLLQFGNNGKDYVTKVPDEMMEDEYFNDRGIVHLLEDLGTYSNIDKSKLFIVKAPKDALIKAKDTLDGKYTTQRDDANEIITTSMQLADIAPSDMFKKYNKLKRQIGYDPWNNKPDKQKMHDVSSWFYDYISKYLEPRDIISDGNLKDIIIRFYDERDRQHNIIDACGGY